VYAGADGDFTLYDDDNTTYSYENGAYSTIPIHWDDGARTLTIGDRKGGFPGMLQHRTFHIVFAGNGHGTGIDVTAEPDKVVEYDGKSVSIKQ
jgi:alpha-D-xyloside xylohydrolase